MLRRDDRDGRDVSITFFWRRIFPPGQLTLRFRFFSLPSMSDSARKRKLADFVVFWKKQVVKLYAVTKWSRDADIVQKCMVCRPASCMVASLTHF